MNFFTKAIKSITGIQAYQDRKKAISVKESADALLRDTEAESEAIRNETNNALEEFGRVRLECLKESLAPFLKFIKILDREYSVKEYEVNANVAINAGEIKEMEAIEMNASTALDTLVAGGSVASVAIMGVPTAVTSTVTALATASTGTAISSLSGAAASNAVLAWLGGGSLAAGGGGMAAGAAVLSTITYATAGVAAIAAAGLIASSFYSKKLTDATARLEQVKEYRAKSEVIWELLRGTIERTEELKDVTLSLSERINEQLDYLEPLIYDFDHQDEYYVKKFQSVQLLEKALSEISQVPVLDEKGNISKESGIAINKTQKILNSQL